jgi:hypothetical protein
MGGASLTNDGLVLMVAAVPNNRGSSLAVGGRGAQI